MLTALHHFNLIVSDKENTKRFYNGVLGLEIALETEIDDGEFSRGVGLPGTKVLATFFKLPGSNGLIETFQYVNPKSRSVPPDAKANDGGWQHLCFSVDDIEKTKLALEAQGIEFLSTPVTISPKHPDFAGVQFCYFLGPDREVIEIAGLGPTVKSELFQLVGRTALITGGGSGLGRAICIGFAEAGARVSVADISLENAIETARMIEAQGGEAFAERLDVTRRSEVETLTNEVFRRLGSLDILVNSAGRAIRGTALEYKEEDWATIIGVNLTGTFFCCQAAGRHMASQQRGKIINIASIGGFVAYAGSIAYLASKGGVVQLTRGFAIELAPYNVQVNAIAPSLFDTPMVVSTRSDAESHKYFMDRTPAGRKGRPEEIVGAAIFLAADCSSMVTGHTLAVDGGYLSA